MVAKTSGTRICQQSHPGHFFILQVLLANVDPYPRPRSFTQFFFFSM